MRIRVFLRGGLGNQFFQWMHARQLAQDGHEVVLDTSFLRARAGNQAVGGLELEEVFGPLGHRITHMPQLWRIEPVFSRAARWAGLLDSDTPRASRTAPAPWQYGYFQHALNPHGTHVQQARAALGPSLASPQVPAERYAAIHLRIGDYGQSAYNRTQLGMLDMDYYHAACRQLLTQGSMLWLVVSDDYAAARSLCCALRLPGQPNLRFLDEQLGGRDTPRQALQALLHAQTLVCANSSFSAMAAYIGQASTVYAPKPWFRGTRLSHLDPSGTAWTRIAATFRDA